MVVEKGSGQPQNLPRFEGKPKYQLKPRWHCLQLESSAQSFPRSRWVPLFQPTTPMQKAVCTQACHQGYMPLCPLNVGSWARLVTPKWCCPTHSRMLHTHERHLLQLPKDMHRVALMEICARLGLSHFKVRIRCIDPGGEAQIVHAICMVFQIWGWVLSVQNRCERGNPTANRPALRAARVPRC